jgi:hypothetical protein
MKYLIGFLYENMFQIVEVKTKNKRVIYYHDIHEVI